MCIGRDVINFKISKEFMLETILGILVLPFQLFLGNLISKETLIRPLKKSFLSRKVKCKEDIGPMVPPFFLREKRIGS